MKFMNMKRFGATVMAGALALSMAAPAMAASQSTVIDSTFNPITLAVTVPKTAKAIINPYGLPYTMEGEVTVSGANAVITTGSAMLIENRSAVALKVGAKVKGETKGTGVAFATGASVDDAKKEVKVSFEAFEAVGITEANFSEPETVNPKFANLKTADAKLTAAVDTTETTATDAGSGLILREANADGEMQNGGAGFFRLVGTAGKTQTWEKTDGFTTTIAFTFTPDTYTAKSMAPTTTANTLSVAASTTTATVAPGGLPAGVTAKADTIKFSLNDENLASITSAGVVTPKAAGALTVTVTCDGSDGLPYNGTVAITITA